MKMRWFANGTLLAAAAMVATLLLFKVRHAASYGGSELAFYVLLPLLVLAGLLALLLLPLDRRVNAVLALISVGTTVYAAELVLEITARAVPAGTVDTDFPAGFDRRSKLEVVADLERRNVEAHPAVNPSYLLAEGFAVQLEERQLLPLAGISRVTTVLCNETGEYLIYTSDEHGFHNPVGVHSRSARIILLGDSFAHGGCVTSHENVAALLRQRYGDVVNLGFSDNGPLTELATLVEYGAPLEPEVVLWLYYEGNDLNNLHRESRHPPLMRYLEPGYRQQLRDAQPEIDRQLRDFVRRQRTEAESAAAGTAPPAFSLGRFLLMDRLRGCLGLHPEAWKPSSEVQMLPLLDRILERARDVVGRWGGRLYFVDLPSWKRFGNHGQVELHDADVDALLEIAGIPRIDVAESFAAQPDPLAYFAVRTGGHYNADGYALVAQTIAERLKRDGVAVVPPQDDIRSGDTAP